MAGDALPPTSPPPGVLRSARRRLARNAASVVVALAVLTGGVVAGVRLADRDQPGIPIGPSPQTTTGPGPTHVTPPTPCDDSRSPSGACAPTPLPSVSEPVPTGTATTEPTPVPSEPSGGTWTGHIRAAMFIDGVVYQFLQGSQDRDVMGIIPEDTATQPPVQTPYGVLVLGGEPGRAGNVWLIRGGGGVELLESGVDAFAVSGDGARVAYAVLSIPDRSSATLVERSLPTGAEVTSAPIDTHVEVAGYVGEDVLMTTGDGAVVRAAMWQPGAEHIEFLEGYSIAVASDAESGFAVLEHGDGGCWSIVNLLRPELPERSLNLCHITGVSFGAGGEIMAGVEGSPSLDQTGLFLLVAGTSSELGGSDRVAGAFQTWWPGSGQGAETVYVLAEPTAGHFGVTRCRISEVLCSGEPVWTGTGAGGEGSAWIVEERLPTVG